MKNLNNYDWFCDNCGDYLNNQSGFDSNSGVWYCKNCDERNSINSSSIIDMEEYDDYMNSGYDSYKEYINEGQPSEGLSVYDSALIWLSHGKDEDYMFGYTEKELEDALK